MDGMGYQPFETIVEAHHAEIYRYLLRLTSRSSEADDLSQETFLRAYRAFRGLTPDANVRAWLFTIATNLARNHFRAEKRRRLAHAAVQVIRTETDGASPDGETIFREAREQLDGIVAGLPLKQRAAFVLRKVHDLDYDAIARSLDCSAESARSHVFQALKKIRHGLATPTLAGQPGTTVTSLEPQP
jgi:RNA polymerase sigma-70 factor (ECF subfamily)